MVRSACRRDACEHDSEYRPNIAAGRESYSSLKSNHWRSKYRSVREVALTFDDRQRAPLRLFPARPQQPFLHFGDEHGEILRVRLHDFVELGEFTRTKEDLGQTELEIGIAKIQGFEQRLAEEPWIEPCQFAGQVRLVHAVQFRERRTRGKTLLH